MIPVRSDGVRGDQIEWKGIISAPGPLAQDVYLARRERDGVIMFRCKATYVGAVEKCSQFQWEWLLPPAGADPPEIVAVKVQLINPDPKHSSSYLTLAELARGKLVRHRSSSASMSYLGFLIDFLMPSR